MDDASQSKEAIQPLLRLLEELQQLGSLEPNEANLQKIQKLERRIDETCQRLTPWQKTLLARHPLRPYTLDYIEQLFDDFQELHGDRKYGDDPSIVAGMARFRGEPVAVVGHQKGRDIKQKVHRNFGMPNPEGYRKALRVLELAQKFGRAAVIFVDTPGAYPGIGAEERGQAEAIANNLKQMVRLRIPLVVTITGEGGSGGALAIAVGDVINMLEHAVYSVISPEGCASILFRDAAKAPEAANSMRGTAQSLLELEVIDHIVPEPRGGAHTDPRRAAELVGERIAEDLEQLNRLPIDQLLERRYHKFRGMGRYRQAPVPG
ncbi:MAG TPA: acetyl-CoA carboxylase carboxyltransferase subunit alpha [Acidobacteriota bacterium]